MRQSLVALSRRRLVTKPPQARLTRFNSSTAADSSTPSRQAEAATSVAPTPAFSLRQSSPQTATPTDSISTPTTLTSSADPNQQRKHHVQALLSSGRWREAEAALHLTPIPDPHSSVITLEQLTKPLPLSQNSSSANSSNQELPPASCAMLLVHYLTDRGMYYEALMVLEEILVQRHGMVHVVKELSALARGMLAQTWSTMQGGKGAVRRLGAGVGEVGAVGAAAGEGAAVPVDGESAGAGGVHISPEERTSIYTSIRLTHLLLFENVQFHLSSPDKIQREVIPHIRTLARRLVRLPELKAARIFNPALEWEEWVGRVKSIPGVQGMDINELLSGSADKGSLASRLGAKQTSPHESAYSFVCNVISTTSPSSLTPTRITRERVLHPAVYKDEKLFPMPISLVNHAWNWNRDQWERVVRLLIKRRMVFEAMVCLERKRISNVGLWGRLVEAVREGLRRGDGKEKTYTKVSEIYAATRLVHFRKVNEGRIVKVGPLVTRGMYTSVEQLSRLIPSGDWFAPPPFEVEAEVEDDADAVECSDEVRATVAMLDRSISSLPLEEEKLSELLIERLLSGFSANNDATFLPSTTHRPPIEYVIKKRFTIPNPRSFNGAVHLLVSAQDNEMRIPMKVYTTLIEELVKRRMLHRAANALQAVIQGDVGTIPEKRSVFEVIAQAALDGVRGAKEEDILRFKCVEDPEGGWDALPLSYDSHAIMQSLRGIAKLAYLADKRKLPTGDITTLLEGIECVLSLDFHDLAPIGMNKYLRKVTKRLITRTPEGVLLHGGGARWGKDKYGNRKEFRDLLLGEGCWPGYMPRLSKESLDVLERMCRGCLEWEEGVGKVQEIASSGKSGGWGGDFVGMRRVGDGKEGIKRTAAVR